MSINIAIDGPAGAGKSTIARALASRLSYIYVDTGAMYRAMALYLIRMGVDPADSGAVARNCVNAKIGITYEGNEQIILLDGENVNDLLRTEEVGRMASMTSAVPKVRESLLRMQKSLAARYNVIMDGRDIGTVILPQAQVKIFLTASPETRAARRCQELKEKGTEADYTEVLKQILERDERDTNRAASPLKQAADAVLVDTSMMNVEQVLDELETIVRSRIGQVEV